VYTVQWDGSIPWKIQMSYGQIKIKRSKCLEQLKLVIIFNVNFVTAGCGQFARNCESALAPNFDLQKWIL
jgi:hypothetical protein